MVDSCHSRLQRPASDPDAGDECEELEFDMRAEYIDGELVTNQVTMALPVEDLGDL